MARTLHDDLGQDLALLQMALHMISESEQERHLSDAHKLTDGLTKKVRNISYLLPPPLLDESGLMAALHWYFEGLEARGQLRIMFDYRPAMFPRLPNDLETTIFRLIQEALTNVYRHAKSEDACVELIQESSSITLRVRDFGKGISESSISSFSGVGLAGMRERVKQLNGELRLLRVEPGTLVEATLPRVE